MSTFHASRFILGADGVSLEEGVTTPSIGLAGVERAMVRQTRGEIMVLADASKFGVIGDVAICTLDKIDAIIVDDAVDKDVRDEMERLGIKQISNHAAPAGAGRARAVRRPRMPPGSLARALWRRRPAPCRRPPRGRLVGDGAQDGLDGARRRVAIVAALEDEGEAALAESSARRTQRIAMSAKPASVTSMLPSGSSRWMSSPAETRMACGANWPTTGSTTTSNTRPRSRRRGAGRQRHVDGAAHRVALAALVEEAAAGIVRPLVQATKRTLGSS